LLLQIEIKGIIGNALYVASPVFLITSFVLVISIKLMMIYLVFKGGDIIE
jgi:hypothetical protein